jgi:hypothetical protein
VRALIVAAIPLLFVSLSDVAARAVDCGNVTAKGVCQDAKTLVFCESGELEVIRCPSGELCVVDDARFSGAAGCIATRFAGCGAVPEHGLCAGSTLLYCANGRAEELECPAGTRCQSVTYGDAIGSDCVSTSGLSATSETTSGQDDNGTRPDPSEPIDDEDEVDEPTPVQSDGRAPLPSVERGGASAAAAYADPGEGCHGGASVGLFGLLAVLVSRRPLRR